MREKGRIFAKRSSTLESDLPKIKYFFVYEGEKTENIYFEAINNARKRLKINPLIEIIPILRSFNEKGWSNPEKFVQRLQKNLNETQTNKISYETILNGILDYLKDDNLAVNNTYEIIYDSLENAIKKDGKILQDTISFKEINSISEILYKELQKFTLAEITENLEGIIDRLRITYDKDYDKICIIADRDKNSFTERQFDKVLKICNDKNFKFHLTNPCFEFWLLLHYDDVVKLDKEKIKENLKVSSKKTYVEFELRKRLKGYNKSKYNVEEIILNVDKAIKNETQFCEDIKMLKYDIGSNIGLLIQELKNY